jgi:toxin CptA
MSIGISAIVRPSLRLKMAVYCLGAAILATGCVIGFGMGGSYSLFARIMIATASFVGTLAARWHFQHQQKSFRIVISNAGVIRLWQEGVQHEVDEIDSVYRMLPNSTLWPNLLLLSLRSENAQTLVLPILPDSVSQQEFRALSVALRWIASRGGESGDETVPV